MIVSLSFEDVSTYVCRKEGYLFQQINVKCRERKLVEVRHLIMKLAHDFTDLSLESIGSNFIHGGDHANVLYACNNIQNLYDTDMKWRFKVDQYYKYFKELRQHKYLYIPALPNLIDLGKIREKMGITLRQVEAGVSLDHSYIRKLELGLNGKYIPYNTAKKILDFYISVAIEKEIDIIT